MNIHNPLSPFMGKWALPGGFVVINEDLETATRRDLKEEADIIKLACENFQPY